MFPRHPEDIPELITARVLKSYSSYMASQAVNTPSMPQAHSPLVETTPASVEETLAPLELLYGKTFLSALGIALHGEEPIVRYVEHDVHSSCPSGLEGLQPARNEKDGSSQVLGDRKLGAARYIYRVGKHLLLSQYYCPCSAYTYQSVRRKKTWCCKHILALRICLELESVGLEQHNFDVQIMDLKAFDELLSQAIREKGE